jgi:hypothetical protein
MAALRRLQTAGQPLDPQLAANVTVQQHERSLELLPRMHLSPTCCPEVSMSQVIFVSPVSSMLTIGCWNDAIAAKLCQVPIASSMGASAFRHC